MGQPFPSGTEQECELGVGFDPYTKPSANGRYLREADGRIRRWVVIPNPDGGRRNKGLPRSSANQSGAAIEGSSVVTEVVKVATSA
jgi:hypothetical protein